MLPFPEHLHRRSGQKARNKRQTQNLQFIGVRTCPSGTRPMVRGSIIMTTNSANGTNQLHQTPIASSGVAAAAAENQAQLPPIIKRGSGPPSARTLNRVWMICAPLAPRQECPPVSPSPACEKRCSLGQMPRLEISWNSRTRSAAYQTRILWYKNTSARILRHVLPPRAESGYLESKIGHQGMSQHTTIT